MGLAQFGVKPFHLICFAPIQNRQSSSTFTIPTNGRLKVSNRRVNRAAMVPWQKVEACYAVSLAGTGQGSPAKIRVIAYGALLIKEQLGITEEETVEQIQENP